MSTYGIYMKYPEKANLWRQKLGWWLPEVGAGNRDQPQKGSRDLIRGDGTLLNWFVTTVVTQ